MGQAQADGCCTILLCLGPGVSSSGCFHDYFHLLLWCFFISAKSRPTGCYLESTRGSTARPPSERVALVALLPCVTMSLGCTPCELWPRAAQEAPGQVLLHHAMVERTHTQHPSCLGRRKSHLLETRSEALPHQNS